MGLPGGSHYFAELNEKQYYLRFTGGIYYKYRGIIVTLGCFVNNIKFKQFDGYKVNGILRKPTNYGPQLTLRFVMW